jgi:hypothetical protein
VSTPLPSGACEPWPILWPCDVSCESPTATGHAAEMATDIIWALSGRQFGLCEITLRPCRRECVDEDLFDRELLPWQGEHIQPALISGQWYNLTCGGCPGSCSCTSISEARLPGIVHSVTEVKVDGVALPSSAYRVDNDRLLVRTDGDQWPHCNDLSVDDTEPGTWSVTAVYGRAVPVGGQWAVGELACELLKAFKGEDCRLPRNVTQLARQGVTISYPDMNDLFSRGRTGLYLADIWISTVNPNRLTNRSRTYSVDRPQPRRTGTA